MRSELAAYLTDTYSAEGEHLFAKYPSFLVFRPTREHLKFVVEGGFDLYAIRADGVRHLVRRCEGFTFLGDLEFCGKDAGMRYQELTKEGLLKRIGKGHYTLAVSKE